MDSKQNVERKTPSKGIFNAVHGRLTHSTFASDSPLRYLPNFSTPPTRLVKVRNPFEPHLAERLHTHFFSPSVFQVSSPKSEEKFKWTIDDISSLKPADIDETELEHYESPEHDSVMESCAQAKIDQFFSNGVVPSPYTQDLKSKPLISDNETPCKVQITYANGSAQTVLSLPPHLPEHVEAVLKPYYSYVKSQQGSDVETSLLYKKLFDFEEHYNESLQSMQSSPSLSLHLSPVRPLPNKIIKEDLGNKYGVSPNKLVECNLSPIGADTSYSSRERKSATRLDFSGYMSVDTSMNVVPDAYDQLPKNDITNTNYDSSVSPLPEVLSDSTVNWDMEYKHITLRTPSKYEKQMEISNSDTPKSKIFTSQRKKLSDSFLRDDSFDDKENLGEEKQEFRGMVENSADAGYHTGVHTMYDDLSWRNSMHLIASTPTKK